MSMKAILIAYGTLLWVASMNEYEYEFFAGFVAEKHRFKVDLSPKRLPYFSYLWRTFLLSLDLSLTPVVSEHGVLGRHSGYKWKEPYKNRIKG